MKSFHQEKHQAIDYTTSSRSEKEPQKAPFLYYIYYFVDKYQDVGFSSCASAHTKITEHFSINFLVYYENNNEELVRTSE